MPQRRDLCDEGLLCEGVTCVSQEGGACTADDECTSALSCKAEGCFASFQGAGRVEVELTWDTPGGDVDLRLNRGGDRYGDCWAHLCYFANCGNDADDFPEWDGDSGRTTGDPVMVLDDLSGFGPERIVVDTPVEGTYWVGADFYSGSTPTAVTVNVLVDGASVAQRTATLENGQWWTAFSFDVVGDAISVSEGGGVVDADDVPAWACK